MLVSQVFVISKLGKIKKKNLSLQKYFLGTFRAFGKQNQYSRSLAQQTTCFRAKFLESEWIIILKWGKAQLWAWRSSASNLYYGFGEEATDFLWKKRCLRQADANLSADVGRWFWHSGKGMAFTPPVPLLDPLNLGPWRWHHSRVSSLQVLFVRPVPAKSRRDPSG